ncbi:methyltransferase [Streptomyces sp. NL15-2K]|nr:methyltransferase [Streptomyces sp. NL15-2K]
MLHYREDWGPTLAELRRILKPGGRLIASVDHPFAINLMHRQVGREAGYKYFDTTNWTEEWTMGGQTALMSIWHRPLHAMIEAFTAAGFRITVISEPEPDPAARELFPEVIAAKPRFLYSCSSSCEQNPCRPRPVRVHPLEASCPEFRSGRFFPDAAHIRRRPG